MTFEGAVPAEHEVYFAITDSTRYRAPTMTLTHHGGMDIEELDKSLVANVPFDPLTGLKAFVVANALSELNAPKELISPLVQQLPKPHVKRLPGALRHLQHQARCLRHVSGANVRRPAREEGSLLRSPTSCGLAFRGPRDFSS